MAEASEDVAELTCVLCHGPADQVGRFCTQCVGYQGRATVARDRPVVGGRSPHIQVLRALRWPLVALLMVAVGLSGARAAEGWVATQRLRQIHCNCSLLHDARVTSLIRVEQHLAAWQLLANLAIGVVFLTWWALAYGNLRAIGVRPKNGPAWAVGSWFVPFVSLVAPKRVADELWMGSDRSTPLGWVHHPGTSSGPVTTWWACWIASLVLPPAALVLATETAVLRPAALPALVTGIGLAFVVSAVLLGIAGLCAIGLVIDITSSQVERTRDLRDAGLLVAAR